MKVLNLYAGIGGNRKLWNGVDCTAVEIEPKIAKIYQDFFPKDKVIVGDAHQYLLEHYDDGWDFIWGSPPCPTHSRMQIPMVFSDDKATGNISRKAVYPDMRLYQEIILLDTFSNCKWCIENVRSYYKPLIKPYAIDRHYFWSNFVISKKEFEWFGHVDKAHVNELQVIRDINIDEYDVGENRRDAIIRSYINPELGKFIFDCAFKLQQKKILEG
jgi:DNA (cytosine-5)-methyltransferase 1